ncbi:MAG: hypothetical protein ABSF91_11580 [Bacteroidota bacterium]|jgi:uncharacterized protein YacL
MRDFFVGLLVGVSLFLVTYRGYEKIDGLVTTISGVAGLGVAVFPCLNPQANLIPVGIFQIAPTISNGIHLTCASIFFLLLAINSFFLFTLSKGPTITWSKRKRNRIYKTCGAAIFVCIVALLIFHLALSPEEANESRIVLVFETVMLLAFGVSWLVKGETLFRDKPSEML